MVITPSPNFLWNTLTPVEYLDKSTLSPAEDFPRPFKKLSADLPKLEAFPNTELAAATVLPAISLILYDLILPAPAPLPFP